MMTTDDTVFICQSTSCTTRPFRMTFVLQLNTKNSIHFVINVELAYGAQVFQVAMVAFFKNLGVGGIRIFGDDNDDDDDDNYDDDDGDGGGEHLG